MLGQSGHFFSPAQKTKLEKSEIMNPQGWQPSLQALHTLMLLLHLKSATSFLVHDSEQQ